jgi:RNA polymerase sigma-70 factor (ECF subfamily)
MKNMDPQQSANNLYRPIVSSENPDWPLVEQVKEGKDRAFDALMERYKKPILNFIYRMVGNVAEAEDIAQDVFVRTYQSICKPAFRIGEGKFSTWLFQIAHNAATDNLRRQKRQPTDSINDLEKHKLDLAITGKTADKILAEQELGKQISDAISKLPSDQKTAIVLSEYHDMSYSEISEIMKCSEKSVESRLYRAKNTLRQRLAHLLHDSGKVKP